MTSTTNTQCDTFEDTHAGHTATDRTGVNPLTGDTFTVYTCNCGQDDMEVFTQYL